VSTPDDDRFDDTDVEEFDTGQETDPQTKLDRLILKGYGRRINALEQRVDELEGLIRQVLAKVDELGVLLRSALEKPEPAK
jgi:hypothetical protein